MGRSGTNPYRRRGSPYWQILYRDAEGRKRRESTKTGDIVIARAILAERVKEAAQGRVGHRDEYAATRRADVDDLIEAFCEARLGRGITQKRVSDLARFLRSVCSRASVRRLDDVDVARVERVLATIRRERSVCTRDHHAAALRTFGLWLVRSDRWPTDPFAAIETHTRTEADRKFDRRALRLEELELLAAAAPQRAVQRWVATHPPGSDDDEAKRASTIEELERRGRERGLLYLFLAYTGMRRTACQRLRWRDVVLDGEHPRVVIRAETQKGRRDHFVPLAPWLVSALPERRRERALWGRHPNGGPLSGPVRDSDPLFHVPDKLAELLRHDAEFAGLGDRDPTWDRLDAHALRKSCATLLVEAGMPPAIAQKVLGHKRITTTMKYYARIGDDLVRSELARLPAPVCTPVCTQPVPGESTHGTPGHTEGDDDPPQTDETKTG